MTPELARAILAADASYKTELREWIAKNQTDMFGSSSVNHARTDLDILVMEFMREWVRAIAERSANPHHHDLQEIHTGATPSDFRDW